MSIHYKNQEKCQEKNLISYGDVRIPKENLRSYLLPSLDNGGERLIARMVNPDPVTAALAGDLKISFLTSVFPS